MIFSATLISTLPIDHVKPTCPRRKVGKMLEKQLKVGDVLLSANIGPGSIGASDGGNRLSNEKVVDRTMEVKRTTKIQKSFGLIKWSTSKETIFETGIFRWLPYVENRINCTEAGGKDVLSGYFSGCWLSMYTDRGILKVAHVFCDANETSDTRKQWWSYKSHSYVNLVSEFKPDDYQRGGDKTFGLFTADGNRYTITCRIYNPEIANPYYKNKQWWKDKYRRTDRSLSTNEVEILAKKASKIKKLNLNAIYPGLSFQITDIFHKVPPGTFPAPESPQVKFNRAWQRFETGDAFRN